MKDEVVLNDLDRQRLKQELVREFGDICAYPDSALLGGGKTMSDFKRDLLNIFNNGELNFKKLRQSVREVVSSWVSHIDGCRREVNAPMLKGLVGAFRDSYLRRVDEIANDEGREGGLVSGEGTDNVVHAEDRFSKR